MFAVVGLANTVRTSFLLHDKKPATKRGRKLLPDHPYHFQALVPPSLRLPHHMHVQVIWGGGYMSYEPPAPLRALLPPSPRLHTYTHTHTHTHTHTFTHTHTQTHVDRHVAITHRHTDADRHRQTQTRQTAIIEDV